MSAALVMCARGAGWAAVGPQPAQHGPWGPQQGGVRLMPAVHACTPICRIPGSREEPLRGQALLIQGVGRCRGGHRLTDRRVQPAEWIALDEG